MKALAYANNSTVYMCCLPEAAIADCLGFSVRKIDKATGKKEPLPSMVPFEGQETSGKYETKTTDVWPIQKFSWKYFGGEEGKTYQFEFVPMVGTPDKLTAREDLAVLTNEVTLAAQHGDITARFTNGILSTQWLANQLPKAADGSPDFEALLKAIKTPGNPIREKLSGGIAKMLMEPILRAKASGGRVYQALYELSDPELVDCLVENALVVSLILSNTGEDDQTNKASREQLHKAGADISDRMLASTEIGHNKSTTSVDAQQVPQDVTTGSTNWTPTGLCCQSNNVLRVKSVDLATIYMEYWKLLREDGSAQGEKLRTANATLKKQVVLPDGTRITVWFSPNMKERTKPKQNAPVPPDMADVFDRMEKARRQILFLAFYPGFPSIISKVQTLQGARPDLMIRGAVSSPDALPRNSVQLFHRQNETPAIVAAEAIEEEFGPWHKELLKAGPDAHAIIHDKIVVIDPLSETDCVVILGSHNLGFKASYQNDENMLIIEGNRSLALAYMVHILDVYDHYRFRYLRHLGKSTFKGFLSTSPDWQNKYLSGAPRAELEYYTGIANLIKAA